MFRRLFAVMALAIPLLTATPAAAQSAPACQYILGFATLHALDPADTGGCTDNQAFAANGDAQQHTTKGLMAWRKADNWTAFTNGYWTWINGPNGLAKRLNTQRFSWEANPAGLPVVGAQGAPPAPPVGGQPAGVNTQTVQGTGTTVRPINLPNSGIAVVKLHYAGSDNFIVRLLDSSGADYGPSLANVIGAWTGTAAINVDAGSYLLSVQASGPWTVTVTNAAHWPNGGSIATPLMGQGTNIVPVTLVAGLATVGMQYTGSDNFIVRLLNDDGTDAGTSLANVIDAWSGTVAINVPVAGNYIVTVESSGPWSISISQ